MFLIESSWGVTSSPVDPIANKLVFDGFFASEEERNNAIIADDYLINIYYIQLLINIYKYKYMYFL
jgi:hypothetical protein